MNIAVILAGGVGSRMRTDGFPKQYIEINDKPILVYTLEKFSEAECIDKFVIVANQLWHDEISSWIEHYGIKKFFKFAVQGESRQESILNGLEVCLSIASGDYDKVIIHDSVRPLVSKSLIKKCLAEIDLHDGCMPVLPLNDTVYQSFDSRKISSLIDRSTLFAGQAPEAFNFKKYYAINKEASKDTLAQIRGSSEIAFKNDLDVVLIPGEDQNFKLTTPADLDRFKSILER